MTMLLASHRREEGQSCCLPSEVWLQVFRHMHRDWFDDEAARARRLAARERRRAAREERMRERARQQRAEEEARALWEAQIGCPPGLSGGGGVSAETEAILRDLRDTEDTIRMLSSAIEGDELARVVVAGPMNTLTRRRDELRAQLLVGSAGGAGSEALSVREDDDKEEEEEEEEEEVNDEEEEVQPVTRDERDEPVPEHEALTMRERFARMLR